MNPTINPATPPEPQAGATTTAAKWAELCRARAPFSNWRERAFEMRDHAASLETALATSRDENQRFKTWIENHIKEVGDVRKEMQDLREGLATSRAETEALKVEQKEFIATAYQTQEELETERESYKASFESVQKHRDYLQDAFSKESEALRAQLATLTATLAQQRETGQAEYSRVERELQRASAARDTALARVRELEAAIAERVAAKEEYDSNSGVTCLRCGEADKQLKRVLAAAARAAGTGEEGQ